MLEIDQNNIDSNDIRISKINEFIVKKIYNDKGKLIKEIHTPTRKRIQKLSTKKADRRKTKIPTGEYAEIWKHAIKHNIPIRSGNIIFSFPLRCNVFNHDLFYETLENNINKKLEIENQLEIERVNNLCKSKKNLMKRLLTKPVSLLRWSLWSVYRLVRLPDYLWQKIR